MIQQYIQVGNHKWGILVYYNVSEDTVDEVIDALKNLDCPKNKIYKASEVLTQNNTGMTFTNPKYKMSIIAIAEATSKDQFLNTLTHEVKHIQSHICDFYKVPEDGEDAAYLTGYLIQQMYKVFQRLI